MGNQLIPIKYSPIVRRTVLVFGLSHTVGLFLGEFMETFGTDRFVTSMVLSTQMMVLYMVGPVAAVLIDRFGCVKTAITGSILAAIGLVISGVAPNFATLWISSGFVTGNFARCISF